MNTRAELVQAVEDFQAGRLGTVPADGLRPYGADPRNPGAAIWAAKPHPGAVGRPDKPDRPTGGGLGAASAPRAPPVRAA